MKIKKVKWIRIAGLAAVFLGLAATLSFARGTHTSLDPRLWFKSEYYSQFLPIAVSVMLMLCGILVALNHKAANFNLAVFGHTAAEEALFNWLGITRSSLPSGILFAFFLISIAALWIAYSNVLKQKRLSLFEALFGIIFGALLVLGPRLL